MNFLKWIWGKYSKNTFVRHAVVFLAALGVLEWGTTVSDTVSGWLSNPLSKEAVGAAFAVALRWAQTNFELWVVKLRAKQT